MYICYVCSIHIAIAVLWDISFLVHISFPFLWIFLSLSGRLSLWGKKKCCEMIVVFHAKLTWVTWLGKDKLLLHICTHFYSLKQVFVERIARLILRKKTFKYPRFHWPSVSTLKFPWSYADKHIALVHLRKYIAKTGVINICSFLGQDSQLQHIVFNLASFQIIGTSPLCS